MTEQSSAAKVILEKTLHLFLLRFVYKLLTIIIKGPMIILGWPVFGFFASGFIGFYTAKKIGQKGWLYGAIPTVIVSFVTIALTFALPGGLSIPSLIFYSLIFVIAGVVGGALGQRKALPEA